MNSSTTSMASTTRVPVKVARRLVSLASRAPSVHNTQPWSWRLRDDRLELHADWSRRLEVADPDGRNLVISCGAALHHLQIAASASGWRAAVTRVDDTAQPSLLAQVRLSPSPPPHTAAADLRAIAERCTDRRRFTSWPVPHERLQLLVAAAEGVDGEAAPIVDVSDRFRVEMLVIRAHRLQERNASVAAEAARWTDRGAYDGVPSAHVPDAHVGPATRRSRFAPGGLEDEGRHVESGDGLVILYDSDDTPAAWLRAGESLSALWLRAVGEGLSVVPLSQVVEVAETRDALQHEILGGRAVPLMLVRVGWQAISRSQLEPSPRRPLDGVLHT
jgi:nitroreductase